MDGKWFGAVLVSLMIRSMPRTGLAQENLQSLANDDESSGTTSIYRDIPQFGGRTSVGGQLAEDATVVSEYRLQKLQDLFVPRYEMK